MYSIGAQETHPLGPSFLPLGVHESDAICDAISSRALEGWTHTTRNLLQLTSRPAALHDMDSTVCIPGHYPNLDIYPARAQSDPGEEQPEVRHVALYKRDMADESSCRHRSQMSAGYVWNPRD